MRIKYFEDTDTLYVQFGNNAVAEINGSVPVLLGTGMKPVPLRTGTETKTFFVGRY